MIRHVIMWNVKPDFDEAKKAEAKKTVKEVLEGMNGKIPGMISCKVITEPVVSGFDTLSDIMLEAEFTDLDALKAYQVNPVHRVDAVSRIVPYLHSMMVMDYEA